MNKLLIVVLLIMTTTSWAYPASMEINGGGQIRQGRSVGEPRFVSFRDEVKREVLKRHQVGFVGADMAGVIVNYSYEIIHETFYSLFPEGTVFAEIVKIPTYDKTTLRFNCPFSVNDGGNITLKPVCAKKLAKEIVSKL